jgi:hypothetical protein
MSDPSTPAGVEPVRHVRRAPVFVALIALIAAGAVIDRLPHRGLDADRRVRVATMPIAAPATSLSSTWFCAGGTARPEGVDGLVADGAAVIANPGDRQLTGTVRIVPSEGEAKTLPVQVGPRSRTLVRFADVVAAPYAAALVELDGGGAVVEHQIHGPTGYSTAPCAPAASERWYLAEGSTAREGAFPEDRMLLALYNPFPEDAIVDLSFTHEEGRAVPSDFTGLVVKGGALRIVSVGEHVRRRAHISMTAVARSGRIVVDRIQQRNGAVKGISLALAATTPATTWYFPEGYLVDGLGERYHVFNPSDDEAQVALELALESGAAEPFDLTIPPRGRVTVVANDEERVPRGVGHAATVVSLNGVPVVAERSVTATPPATRTGVADTLGATMLATRWVLAAGAATSTVDQVVAVFNPGPGAATFTIQALASGQLFTVETLQDIPIPPGRRVTVRLTDHLSRDDAFLVSASSPVVVERGVYFVGSPGLALSAGVPLREP